jgi:hypothetical protein
LGNDLGDFIPPASPAFKLPRLITGWAPQLTFSSALLPPAKLKGYSRINSLVFEGQIVFLGATKLIVNSERSEKGSSISKFVPFLPFECLHCNGY